MITQTLTDLVQNKYRQLTISFYQYLVVKHKMNQYHIISQYMYRIPESLNNHSPVSPTKKKGTSTPDVEV